MTICCELTELLLGVPIFPGSSGVDQCVEIIKALGTPTRDDFQAMIHIDQDFQYPRIPPTPWSLVFKPTTAPEAIDLVEKMLRYAPESQVKSIEEAGNTIQM
jgi:glycogen synthase kinase 3 beta